MLILAAIAARSRAPLKTASVLLNDPCWVNAFVFSGSIVTRSTQGLGCVRHQFQINLLRSIRTVFILESSAQLQSSVHSPSFITGGSNMAGDRSRTCEIRPLTERLDLALCSVFWSAKAKNHKSGAPVFSTVVRKSSNLSR